MAHAFALQQAYIDESGDVVPFTGSHYLVIAALIVPSLRPVELQIKRIRSSLGRRARPDELKASSLAASVTEQLLTALAKETTDIVAVIINKAAILRPPLDPEDIYREAVTRAVRHCVQQRPHLEIWLDKRYTRTVLRDRLERAIRTGIIDVPQQIVLLHQEDSHSHKGLQAADQVAWAFFQKYERGNSHFVDMIQHRVIIEEVVERRLW